MYLANSLCSSRAILIVLLLCECSHSRSQAAAAADPNIVVDTPCEPTFRIFVRDSVTGLGIGGAVGLVVEGTYSDSLVPKRYHDGVLSEYWAAKRHPGTFAVRVTRDGYRSWAQDGLVVPDTCTTESPRFIATLVPQ